MEQILLVAQVIIAAALIGMVLIQRSDTDGFGLGSGGGSGLLSGRAKANLLTRTTAIIATLFILNSLALSVLASHHHAPSIVETIEKQQSATTPLVTKDKKEEKTEVVKKPSAAPTVPNVGETKPVAKTAKKVKAAIDAGVNADTTGADKSE